LHATPALAAQLPHDVIKPRENCRPVKPSLKFLQTEGNHVRHGARAMVTAALI
jgi:hypothetical protein